MEETRGHACAVVSRHSFWAWVLPAKAPPCSKIYFRFASCSFPSTVSNEQEWTFCLNLEGGLQSFSQVSNAYIIAGGPRLSWPLSMLSCECSNESLHRGQGLFRWQLAMFDCHCFIVGCREAVCSQSTGCPCLPPLPAPGHSQWHSSTSIHGHDGKCRAGFCGISFVSRFTRKMVNEPLVSLVSIILDRIA